MEAKWSGVTCYVGRKADNDAILVEITNPEDPDNVVALEFDPAFAANIAKAILGKVAEIERDIAKAVEEITG